MDIDNRILRTLDAVISGLGFSFLSLTALSLVLRKEVGHRLLLWLTVIYFTVRSITSFAYAYEYYYSLPSVAFSWWYCVTGLFGLVFGCIVLASRDDMLTTLRTSEASDVTRKLRADDIEQARLNFEYIDTTSRERSLELVKSSEAKNNVRC